MKIKKEYPILIAIIAALAAYLYFKPTDRMQYTLPKTPEVARADINRIEIVKPGNDILSLEKKDETWKIGDKDYPADQQKVDNILDTLSEFSVTDLVSESKAYERFDLDPEKRIQVRAFNGTDLVRNFDMGKTAASFRHTYVKLADDDAIYQAAGNFKKNFDQTVDAIRDKTVTRFPVERIASLSVVRDGETFAFERVQKPSEPEKSDETASADTTAAEPALEWVWNRNDGETASDTDMQAFLTKADKIKCQRFETNAEEGAYTNPAYQFNLTDTDGATFTLSIYEKFDKDINDYPATSTTAMEPFILSRWEVKQLLDKLPIPKPPEADGEQTQS